MDNYIVSARKYRPDTFESVVGQDSITKTLKNAIKSKHLAQAYLFCGPRGVGKTTCARIFAKTINCTQLKEDYEACNMCESCVAFNKLRSLNIHELDAASNNSVDDIRNLIDKVRIPPQIGKYSVYIIDEVHMLSSSAFNAFLKTLEEPPSHVIFILATTEKHKIIPTILSRCQIFDFNRIQIEDIRKRLEFVAQKESINAENDALHIIAQKADGAMRDALSIFDQIVSFSGNNVTYQETIKNLNVLDYDYYFKMTEAFLTGNYSDAIVIFDDILNKGFEGGYFISGLASHFRDLLMCKEPKTIDLLEVGKNIKKEYIKYAAKCTAPFLFNAIDIANESDLKYKQSQNKRLLIELSLLKITKLANPIHLESVQEQSSISDNKKASTVTKKTEETTSKQAKETEKTSQDTTKTEKEPEKPTKKVGEETETKKETVKSFSLKEMANKTDSSSSTDTKDKAEEKPDNYSKSLEKIGEDAFDEEKFKYVWAKYAETQRSSDKRLFAYFTQAKPEISGNKIFIPIYNHNIKSKIESIINEIKHFLAKELNNKNIVLELKDQIEEAKNTVQTDEDKLKSFIKKNPEIKNLKDQLNLDLY